MSMFCTPFTQYNRASRTYDRCALEHGVVVELIDDVELELVALGCEERSDSVANRTPCKQHYLVADNQWPGRTTIGENG